MQLAQTVGAAGATKTSDPLAFAPFPVSPGLLAGALAAYMLFIERNIQFGMLLAVLAVLTFEWSMSPPKGH
ncbi:MAG: hypothetical protein NTY90_02100 [Candidatus Micrarchaeota archaeon]|nr:hypothetical protein [Candidatus Micrarchaeota archaeon]